MYPPCQGKIACANVISDLYAMGVTECDNMLMLLGISQKMSDKERDVVVPLICRGFKVGEHYNSAVQRQSAVTAYLKVSSYCCLSLHCRIIFT